MPNITLFMLESTAFPAFPRLFLLARAKTEKRGISGKCGGFGALFWKIAKDPKSALQWFDIGKSGKN